MNRYRTLLLTPPIVLVALLLTACPPPPALPDPDPELTVTIASPVQDVAVNGSLTVQVVATGGTPDEVRLLRDGAPLVALSAPYTYSWDTTAEAEGEYQLVAEASAGDATYQSDPLTVTVDRTAPTVGARSPAPGDTNVSARSALVATFSEAVRSATITDATVQLGDSGGALTATLELSPDGRTLTVTPTAVPEVPTTLTVTLTDGITDLAGNALQPPGDAWSVPLPVWLALGDPLSANPGDTIAYASSVAVGSDGAPVVAWSESDGAVVDIHVRRWNGATWEALGGPLSANPGATNAASPSLAIDGSDAPLVAWRETDGAATYLYARRWNGTDWEPLGGPISANPGATNACEPSLALGGAGAPVIAWREFDGAVYHIYLQRWNGSAWEPLGSALSANPGSTSAFQPSLAIGSDDTPVVAWHEGGAITTDVHVARWNGASWAPVGVPLSALPDTTPASFASLALDGSDAPYVAWREVDGADWDIYVQRWNGSGWIPVGGALSANPGITEALSPSPTIDAGDAPIVAWDEFDGAVDNIYVQRWSDGSWTPLGGALSADPGAIYTVTPSLALDSDDTAFVVGRSSTGVDDDMHVWRYNR